jgi:hypothetical protein
MSRPLNYLMSIQLIRAQHEKFKHSYDAHSERSKLYIDIKMRQMQGTLLRVSENSWTLEHDDDDMEFR